MSVCMNVRVCAYMCSTLAQTHACRGQRSLPILFSALVLKTKLLTELEVPCVWLAGQSVSP